MSRFDPASRAGRLAASVRTTDWKGRAKQAVRTLKDEYEAGKRGDDSPAEPIWASPREQLDAVLGLLRSAAAASETPSRPADTDDVPSGSHDSRTAHDSRTPHDTRTHRDGGADADADATPDDLERAGDTNGSDLDDDAEQVAAALRRVDWTRVRAATGERSADAARAVRSMAEQVDWSKVQPVAAQVSSALIAAVASGQLGVGGRLGTTVARAIVDQGGLAQHVAARVGAQHLAVPAELRQVIDATARES